MPIESCSLNTSFAKVSFNHKVSIIVKFLFSKKATKNYDFVIFVAFLENMMNFISQFSRATQGNRNQVTFSYLMFRIPFLFQGCTRKWRIMLFQLNLWRRHLVSGWANSTSTYKIFHTFGSPTLLESKNPGPESRSENGR